MPLNSRHSSSARREGSDLRLDLAAYRRLLARLCLVREELGVAAADMGADAEGTKGFDEARSTYQRLLPQGAAAFIKELLAVSQPGRRCCFEPLRTQTALLLCRMLCNGWAFFPSWCSATISS